MLSVYVLVGMTIAVAATIIFFALQLSAGFRHDGERVHQMSVARSIAFLAFVALGMLSPNIRTALKFVFLFVFIVQGIAILLQLRSTRHTI